MTDTSIPADPTPQPTEQPARELTKADRERIAAAQAKRDRKAAKRLRERDRR